MQARTHHGATEMPRPILLSSSDEDVARIWHRATALFEPYTAWRCLRPAPNPSNTRLGRKSGSGDSTLRVSVVNLLSGRRVRGPTGSIATSLLLITALVLAGAGCSTPPKIVRTDPEIERNVTVARSAYAAGSAEKAAIYYQKALQRARIMDSSSEIARNAYNLAACLAALHSYDAAQACLDEAQLEFQRAGIPCRELPLLEAKIARAQGHSQKALSLARAEQKKPDDPNDAIRVQWHLLLAELLCDQDQAANADTELATIDPKQLKACGNDIQAETALTRARVQMLKRNPQAAALQYDIAARYWQAAGRYGDMVRALEQAGHAYEDAGNSPMAVDRYYRSARSLFESGQLARARDLTDRALPLAVAVPDLQKQLERLKAEIDRQTQKVQPSAK